MLCYYRMLLAGLSIFHIEDHITGVTHVVFALTLVIKPARSEFL
jgi:hypothetical protein